MNPIISNSISRLQDVGRSQFWSGVVALIAATSISGCAIISRTPDPVGVTVSVPEDPRNKLKNALLDMKINFNGKREAIPPGISLVASVNPGNYYIQYAKLSKVTPTQLEIDSTGRLITRNIHIIIDAFDIVTSIYAKNKYGLKNGDICTVEMIVDENGIAVFYVKKTFNGNEQADTESLAPEKEDPA